MWRCQALCVPYVSIYHPCPRPQNLLPGRWTSVRHVTRSERRAASLGTVYIRFTALPPAPELGVYLVPSAHQNGLNKVSNHLRQSNHTIPKPHLRPKSHPTRSGRDRLPCMQPSVHWPPCRATYEERVCALRLPGASAPSWYEAARVAPRSCVSSQMRVSSNGRRACCPPSLSASSHGAHNAAAPIVDATDTSRTPLLARDEATYSYSTSWAGWCSTAWARARGAPSCLASIRRAQGQAGSQVPSPSCRVRCVPCLYHSQCTRVSEKDAHMAWRVHGLCEPWERTAWAAAWGEVQHASGGERHARAAEAHRGQAD
jgi:hypothetical protein